MTFLLKQWTYLAVQSDYNMTKIEAGSYFTLTKSFGIPSTCIESRKHICNFRVKTNTADICISMFTPTRNYSTRNLKYRGVDLGYIVRDVNMSMRELHKLNNKELKESTSKLDASVLELMGSKPYWYSDISPLHTNASYVAMDSSD